jgi:2-polyprenyl-6-methoxyphenol hydroxylase-like FAD-dependent oxidoreductase
MAPVTAATASPIGSGTKLAMEDAIALARNLQEHAEVEPALEAYGKEERQTALLLPQREARLSAQWFERIPRYIGLDTPQFAALLRQRRSSLLARVPPRGYYRLYQATEEITLWRRLWELVGARRRDRYVRRRA